MPFWSKEMNLFECIFGVSAVGEGKIYISHGAEFGEYRTLESPKFAALFILGQHEGNKTHGFCQATHVEKPSQSHIREVSWYILNDKGAAPLLRIKLFDWHAGREVVSSNMSVSNGTVLRHVGLTESDDSRTWSMYFGVRIGSQTADTGEITSQRGLDLALASYITSH